MPISQEELSVAVHKMDLADPEIPDTKKDRSRSLLQNLRERLTARRNKETQEKELAGQLEPLVNAVTTELEKIKDYRVIAKWSTIFHNYRPEPASKENTLRRQAWERIVSIQDGSQDSPLSLVLNQGLVDAIGQLWLKDEEISNQGFRTEYSFHSDPPRIDVSVRKQSDLLLTTREKKPSSHRNFERALEEFVAIGVGQELQKRILIPLRAALDEITTLEDFKKWFGITDFRSAEFDKYVELTKSNGADSGQRRKSLWDGYFIENVRYALNPVIEQGVSQGGYTDFDRDTTDHWFYLSLHGRTFIDGEQMIIDKLREIVKNS